VLIQSDLTAVATGPIDPRVHHILRRFAVVEARGQGTVYRIDAETIEDSMQSGLSPDDALAELAEISAEELPSTLEFLVRNTASKLRRVQVAGARSVLIVDDPVDLDVILSDQAMLPAGLERLAPTVAIGQLGPERTMHLLESAEHHAGWSPSPNRRSTCASGPASRTTASASTSGSSAPPVPAPSPRRAPRSRWGTWIDCARPPRRNGE